MAGRPRIPTDTLKLRDTLRKERRPLKEPIPLPRKPARPGWLVGPAGDEWERICEELDGMGLLRSCDRAMLVAYCQAWGQFEEASQRLKKTGTVTTTDKGNEIQHPLVGVLNKAVERMLKIVTQFGLTPAARSRIETGTAEHRDALEEFVDGCKKQRKQQGGHEEVDSDCG